MTNLKTGVLLINLGTPDTPSVKDVRQYLREFLMDRRVIDIPYFKRWPLIHGIIAPFRAPESAKAYQQLWTEEGSPLKIYTNKVTTLLQKELGNDYIVSFAMRYQNPSIEDVLANMAKQKIANLIVIPLYPQYASSSTGSTVEKVMNIVQRWEVIPNLKIITNFPNNEDFIDAWVEIAKKYIDKANYEHFIFSYHGLPERHIRKSSCDGYCQLNSKCCSVYHQSNQFCYRAQCFETTRQLTKRLNIPEDKHTLCFQSRLGRDPWVKPYTDDVIKELAQKGVNRVLAFSPAFVADCLETTVEVGQEYKDLFLEQGGKQWDLVESLNESPLWIKCLNNLVCS